MEVTSVYFLIFLLVSYLLMCLAKNAGQRQWVFASMAVCYTVVATAPDWSNPLATAVKLSPIAVFFLVSLIGLFFLRQPANEKLKRWILRVLLTFTVLSFLWIKQYSVFSKIPALHLTEPSIFATVGLSYILFRTLHILIDSQTDEKARLPHKALLAYLLNPFTFVSGPIQRAQAFFDDWQAGLKPLPLKQSVSSCSRVISGYFKVVVVGTLFHSAFTTLNTSDVVATRNFAMASILYTGFLYFNFSGYMDIVIGLGQFFGLKIPENFNRPFLAANFLDFWSRWHMTLSIWFKTYVFNPVVTQIARLDTRTRLVPFYAVVGFFITFLLMGVWHGTTMAYVYYGTFLALGVSGNKLYETKLRDWIGKQRLKALRSHSGYSFLCRCLTGAYFSYALTCVWMPSERLVDYVSNVSWRHHLVCFFAVAALYGAIYGLIDGVTFLVHRTMAKQSLGNRLNGIPPEFVTDAWTGIQLILVLVFLARRESAPGFVYKVF